MLQYNRQNKMCNGYTKHKILEAKISIIDTDKRSETDGLAKYGIIKQKKNKSK